MLQHCSFPLRLISTPDTAGLAVAAAALTPATDIAAPLPPAGLAGCALLVAPTAPSIAPCAAALDLASRPLPDQAWLPLLAPAPAPAPSLCSCSEVRKTLIGRAMCERYASHLGLGQHLVVGKSVRVQSEGKASINMVSAVGRGVSMVRGGSLVWGGSLARGVSACRCQQP